MLTNLVTLPVKNLNEKGVTTVEYAVMLILVALAVVAFGSQLSTAIVAVFSRVIAALS